MDEEPDEPARDREDRRLPASPTLTRRQFAAGAGAALLLPLPGGLSPWHARDGPGVAAPGAPRQQEDEEPPGTEALAAYVEARWGDRLSENHLEQIRSSVAGNLRAASTIGEVPLENGDGPAFVFRPYRGPGS